MTMKDLSVSEAYFLCAVQNKGKIFGYDTAKVTCLMAAVLHEMKQSGLITFSDRKILLTNSTADQTAYLLPVWEHLKESENLDYKHILQDYNSGWSDRHLNALTSAIGTGLAEQGLVTRAKLGIFGGRTYFMPYKDAIPALAAELQVNILYQTPFPMQDGFLWILLEKSGCIPQILPEDQRESIRKKVTFSIQNEPEGELSEFTEFTDKLLTIAKAGTVFVNYES
ncbi:MAG: GPP34 family phosphoprotein [Eubacteriales bacterium]|nr:GPP34 family phosphoprotein [Eubacteriales bacterium]